MTFYLIAKWFFLVMIIVFPLVLFWVWEEINSRRAGPRLTDVWRLLISIVSWIVGFVFAQISNGYHQLDWMVKNKYKPMTEEGMSALSDGPNTTATWIFFGWIPILYVSFFVGRYYSRKRKNSESKQVDYS